MGREKKTTAVFLALFTQLMKRESGRKKSEVIPSELLVKYVEVEGLVSALNPGAHRNHWELGSTVSAKGPEIFGFHRSTVGPGNWYFLQAS